MSQPNVMQYQQQQQQQQQQRADSLSSLQNLGVPLSKADTASAVRSYTRPNPIPSRLDFSLLARTTRTRKCCSELPNVNRMESEAYPIPASYARDLRILGDVAGMPSRLDGRAPVTYGR
jgi:hypothetical protein